MRRYLFIITLLFLLISVSSVFAQSAAFPIPKIGVEVGSSTKPQDVALTLQILALMTVLALAPALIMMVTSFIRVSIVLSFISRAIATQQMPPNQVVMALALFITVFIMSPTIKEVNEKALTPFMNGKFGTRELYNEGIKPIRKFMFEQTRDRQKDIALFVHLAKVKRPKNPDEVPTHVLIPAFMISELTKAFKMGIMIFIPFIVIDLIVASTLMSMGMIMLPPIMISLPLKIILFVLVDGWNLIAWSIVKSFQ